MIKSIGTDLVNIDRINKIGIERFSKRILSEEEINEFNLINNESRKLTYLAGRFAAKEALFKAFQKGDGNANYKDFIILNNEDGAPFVKSKYINDLNCFITISHTDSHAICFIVLEYKDLVVKI